MPRTIKLSLISLIFLSIFTFAQSDIVNKIKINGNVRIPDSTIKMFSQIDIGKDVNSEYINQSLKKLYETNFFNDVSIKLESNILTITVVENPIIENISYNGIKSNTLKEKITENLNLTSRSSFNKILLQNDKNSILSSLKNNGYYFSTIDVGISELDNNKVDLIFNINLGNKAKIKKISFIGDKKYKDKQLRNIIVSEEYKFWKFISGKKYLNESLIQFDKRLLKNFYLNKGYYDISVNSTFAKLLKDDEFELVFNIDSKNKFFFGDLTIELPVDFDSNNFKDLKNFFIELKGKPYSLNSVQKIIKKIDQISISEQFESVKATVNENINLDKINLAFKIEETEKFFVEKINIFGNNITRENVIRNQFYIDEGDPFNEILTNKSINEIKSLNFFKTVESEIIDGGDVNSKIVNIIVEEKPTGEIMAGAGFGTSGEVIEFGVKENNYLGKGVGVTADLSLATDKITGSLDIVNPNFLNTDKSVNLGIQASENDRLSTYGYKSKKIGSLIGTKFEYLEDFKIGLETSTYIEKIETDSTASARQKTQEGDYFDAYLNFNFDYDKRNQKFKTTDGFRSYYSIGLPMVSDTNTLNNFYRYKVYSELYEDNVSSFSISLKSANSITGDDVKLSERLFVPQSKLRGFVNGRIGPKDGDDFIGGNYYALMNLTSTMPQILPNAENFDVVSFIDIANLWGVDDSSLNESNEIRSSIGIGIDWYTIVGPLSFSLAQPISKTSTDQTETFRFNLGTTF
ncbi:outer membrane protein assembly factor BamA [Candidatus Pelagibacter bacterium nBUS_32]|uniref:outer membrane protein assembly factor BamA n=1 Tax=Candidatus Pelagibacter bacterium nBUS_32 TaxID=3374192 RepID=UPI003EB8D08C